MEDQGIAWLQGLAVAREAQWAPTNRKIGDSLLSHLTCPCVLGQETSPWMVSDGCSVGTGVCEWLDPSDGQVVTLCRGPRHQCMSGWMWPVVSSALSGQKAREVLYKSAVHFPYATFSKCKRPLGRMSPQQVDYVCIAPLWAAGWICDKLSLNPLSLLETLELSERDVIRAKWDA